MQIKDLIYSDKDYCQIVGDIQNWISMFSETMATLIDGFKKNEQTYYLKFFINEDVYGEVLESFEESLALLAFEYKIISKNGYNGISECKVFSSFLYHFLRLMPLSANKKEHINVFIFLLERLSKNNKLNTSSQKIKEFKENISYILEEKHLSLDCIYLVCCSTIFKA